MRSPDIDTRLFPGFVWDIYHAVSAYRQVANADLNDEDRYSSRHITDIQTRLARLTDTIAQLPLSQLWFPRNIEVGTSYMGGPVVDDGVIELITIERVYDRKTGEMRIVSGQKDIPLESTGLSELDLWLDDHWGESLDETILKNLPPILQAALYATGLEIPGWEYLNREGKV